MRASSSGPTHVTEVRFFDVDHGGDHAAAHIRTYAVPPSSTPPCHVSLTPSAARTRACVTVTAATTLGVDDIWDIDWADVGGDYLALGTPHVGSTAESAMADLDRPGSTPAGTTRSATLVRLGARQPEQFHTDRSDGLCVRLAQAVRALGFTWMCAHSLTHQMAWHRWTGQAPLLLVGCRDGCMRLFDCRVPRQTLHSTVKGLPIQPHPLSRCGLTQWSWQRHTMGRRIPSRLGSRSRRWHFCAASSERSLRPWTARSASLAEPATPGWQQAPSLTLLCGPVLTRLSTRQLVQYDLRMPLMAFQEYEGHENSLTPFQLAVDPTGNLLFCGAHTFLCVRHGAAREDAPNMCAPLLANRCLQGARTAHCAVGRSGVAA